MNCRSCGCGGYYDYILVLGFEEKEVLEINGKNVAACVPEGRTRGSKGNKSSPPGRRERLTLCKCGTTSPCITASPSRHYFNLIFLGLNVG